MFRPLLRLVGLTAVVALPALLGLVALVSPVPAQQPSFDSALPTPRLASLMPCGGKIGTTVETTFTGIDLEEANKIVFSHPNIKGEILPVPPPMVDPKKQPKQPAPVPQPSKARVTIGADVPPGFYDARIIGKYGISSPRVFVVGELNEVEEKEPNSDVPQAQKIEIGTTVNGVLNPATDVDYFQFTGKKGQRVLASVLTSSIDSRSTPAVELYSKAGRMLGNNRNYSEDDALLDVVLPEDGEYHLRLYEFTHTRGTPEHFYRLSLSTGPWIDAIHPCVVEPGKTTSLTVYGRNLPGGQPVPGLLVDGAKIEKVTVSYTAPADEASKGRMTTTGHVRPGLAGYPGVGFTVKNGPLTSNVFPLTFATAPIVLDAEGQRTEETATVLPKSCEVAGQLLKKGERDLYALDLKKGESVVIDLLGERLGAAAYLGFTLRKAGTKNLLFESQDSTDVIASRFYARTEDPAPYRFTAPEDGKFILAVRNKLGDIVAGPRQFYRVRVGPEQPDFRLVLQAAANTRPEAPTLEPGGRELLAVMALRRDGFDGDIKLEVSGLPAGVSCPPTILPGPMKSVYLVLQAPAGATPAVADITVKGTATIGGKAVVREALPASMVWPLPQPQNPSPAIARAARSFPVAIRPGQPAWDLSGKLDKATVVQGDKATLTVKVERLWPDLKQPIQVQTLATDLPPGLTFNNNQPVAFAPDKKEAPMPVVVGPNTPPGVYLVPLRSAAQVPFNKDPMSKQKQNVNILVPGAHLTLEVLPKTLAKVNLTTQQVAAKIGAQAELGVRLERQFGYDGEFKVEVVLPPNTAGLSFAPLVIPAGQNEGKLVVQVAGDAKEGGRGNLIVRTTALYGANKVPTVQNSQPFSVNVTK